MVFGDLPGWWINERGGGKTSVEPVNRNKLPLPAVF